MQQLHHSAITVLDWSWENCANGAQGIGQFVLDPSGDDELVGRYGLLTTDKVFHAAAQRVDVRVAREPHLPLPSST